MMVLCAQGLKRSFTFVILTSSWHPDGKLPVTVSAGMCWKQDSLCCDAGQNVARRQPAELVGEHC